MSTKPRRTKPAPNAGSARPNRSESGLARAIRDEETKPRTIRADDETGETRDPRLGDADARFSRGQDARDIDAFYEGEDFDESWLERSNLEAPAPRPGCEQRWVSTRVMGQDVPMNHMRQVRQGWRPRSPDTITGQAYPTSQDADGVGYIGYAGLVLMERPTKLHMKARQLHRKKIDDRTQSIDAELRKDEQPGRPFISDRRTTVTTRPVAVQEDSESA